jgi:hypothetical protein
MRRATVATLFASTMGLAVAYGAAFARGGAPAWSPWLLMASLSTFLAAAMLLGATGGPRRTRGRAAVIGSIAFSWLVMLGCFGFALAHAADERPGMPLVLGLPVRAAVVLYGVGLVPLFLLPIVYAATFEIREDDLRRAVPGRGTGRGAPPDESMRGEARERTIHSPPVASPERTIDSPPAATPERIIDPMPDMPPDRAPTT